MFSVLKGWTGLLCAGFVVAQLIGCSGAEAPPERTAAITGKVTYKGQPVEEGTVQISDASVGGGGTGTLGPGGTFKIEGLLAGKYQVAILPPMVEDRGDGKTAPRQVPKVVSNIPEKYRAVATSGFTADALDGDQMEVEFKME